MKKDFGALSFAEKERICEGIFISNGPYWHVYTDGSRMQNIFCCDKDFMAGMWCLAAGVHLCKGVVMLTFELMTNHVHLILAGKREDCIKAFSQIASRLKDAIFLTDEELYSALCSHISKEYSVKTPSQLSAQQKIDTARRMHFDYNATNQQLRRMLRMDMAVLEEMFP